MPTPARLAAAVVVAIALIAYALAQPSLTPPAGPIEESGRFGTLIELNQENTPGDANALFVITQPGSYVLTADADSGARDGIHIASDGVTIDLNGYTLSGDGSAGSTGVTAIPAQTPTGPFFNVTLRNGAVTDYEEGFNSSNFFQGIGSFVTTELRTIRLERLHVTDTERAVRQLGGGVIESCIIAATVTGITASNCVIADCFIRVDADGSGPRGLFGTNVTVRDTHAVITNPLASNGECYQLTDSVITGCTASGQSSGFRLNGKTLANSCVADTVAQGGILTGAALAVDCNF